MILYSVDGRWINLFRSIAGRGKYPKKTLSQHQFATCKTQVHWHEIHILQRQGSDNI